MPPAIPLGGVNHLVGFLEPVHIVQAEALGVSGPNECTGFFVNEVAESAGLGIHFDDAIPLVAAIHLDVAEVTLVVAPMKAGPFPTMLETVHLRFHLLAAGDVEDA